MVIGIGANDNTADHECSAAEPEDTRDVALHGVFVAHKLLIDLTTRVEFPINEVAAASERCTNVDAFIANVMVTAETPLMAEYLNARSALKHALGVWAAGLDGYRAPIPL
jgi:hypothetical protein